MVSADGHKVTKAAADPQLDKAVVSPKKDIKRFSKEEVAKVSRTFLRAQEMGKGEERRLIALGFYYCNRCSITRKAIL